MSDAYIKKYEVHHTKERQKGPGDTPRKQRSAHRRAKPFKIESRWTVFDKDAEWTTHKRYATAEARDQALRKLQREYPKTHNGHEWGLNIEFR